jgi:fructose-1,6-bisphosphatase
MMPALHACAAIHLFYDAQDMDLAARQCLSNTLQPGTQLVAAGYCMYSSATVCESRSGTRSADLHSRV